MKFSIKKDRLIEIISDFTYILKENPIKPQLCGLYINVTDKAITFKGTNTDSDLVIREVSLNDAINGSVLVKPNLILEYIKLIENDVINVETKDGYLCVNDAQFSTMDISNYPEILENLAIPVCKKKSDFFIKIFDKVKFIVGNDSLDPIFSSVKIIFDTDKVELVATDSYRLVYLLENSSNFLSKEILISNESLNIISKLIKDYDAEISLGTTDNNLVVTWANSYFNTKLLNASYPDFRKLLGSLSYDKEIEINKNDFKSVLKRVISVTKSSTDNKNSAIFNFNNKQLNISGFSGLAKTSQKIDILKTGDDLKLSLNCKYISDFLDRISNNVVINASSAMSMIRMTEFNNENYIYLLMPINIGK